MTTYNIKNYEVAILSHACCVKAGFFLNTAGLSCLNLTLFGTLKAGLAIIRYQHFVLPALTTPKGRLSLILYYQVSLRFILLFAWRSIADKSD